MDIRTFSTFGCLMTLVLATTMALSAVVVVPAGHRAVVFNCVSGVEHRSLGEGIHLLVPFMESATQYDVRTQTYTMSHVQDEGDVRGDDSVAALTKDGQNVKMDLSMRYIVQPSDTWQLHQEVGPDIIGKIVRPEAQTVVRNCIAKYTVTELYSANREHIQDSMTEDANPGLSRITKPEQRE